MTLTVCVGASGSGKTTFLNDVRKLHKCIYIRQFHNLRPYIKVSAIPNFNPTDLPYWDIYVREKKEKSIVVGGTIAGRFMAGLSGGQRKLLLFELIFQRTIAQENLLIVLDEPFAGVTDDFVPYIIERLDEMRTEHNILLVTNDHIGALTKLADNTVTVSAIDRSQVKVNAKVSVDRELALLAMSIGKEYSHAANDKDLDFFRKVELSSTGGLPYVFANILLVFGLVLLTFWNSEPGTEALVLIATGLVAFFSLHPYMIQLVDWRNMMEEEAEALLHFSKSMNKFLKLFVTVFLLLFVNCIRFWCQDAVIGTLTSTRYFFSLFLDSFSITSLHILLGLYSKLTEQEVQTLAACPFMCVIFFSTTFSPGAGIPGLQGLKYLFPRFYLWCMLPGVQDLMEGCPESNALAYMAMATFVVPSLFLLWVMFCRLNKKLRNVKKHSSQRGLKKTAEYAHLQLELFGEKALKNLEQSGNSYHASFSTDEELS